MDTDQTLTSGILPLQIQFEWNKDYSWRKSACDQTFDALEQPTDTDDCICKLYSIMAHPIIITRSLSLSENETTSTIDPTLPAMDAYDR
mmetsp:Transcript_3244/g.7395  ORF Transcript_3244/g.7395 Transcript_3244/m.7395 type:complete len:89 (+) Transcript_3244:1262-1528(+)